MILPQPLARQKSPETAILTAVRLPRPKTFRNYCKHYNGFDEMPVKHIAIKILSNAKNKVYALEDL